MSYKWPVWPPPLHLGWLELSYNETYVNVNISDHK